MFPEPNWHTRPLPQQYSIDWEYQACNGSEAIGPRRTFWQDAIEDLMAVADVELAPDFTSYRVFGGNYGMAWVPTQFRIPAGMGYGENKDG